MKTLLLTLTLTATAFAATPSVPQIYAMDDSGLEYSVLYTESAWMALEVPLSDLGGTVPRDLSLAVSGLPEGTTIKLGKVATRGTTVLLHVEVKRTAAAKRNAVNSLATIEVKSGSGVLTTVAIPVQGVAYDR